MPANVSTDESAILNQIVTEIRTLSGASAANVFICARELWLPEPPGDWYIEVVPGAGIDRLAKQGRGMIKDSFRVCVFQRLLVDQEPQDTARIADASLGLLARVKSVEQTLIQSFLSGLALVPVLPDHREAGERNPEDPYDGWAMIPRSFNVEYLYDFPAPHSLS